MSVKSIKNITIRDVAEKAGVSTRTVSKVLNAKTNVKPETRDRIIKVMRESRLRPIRVVRNYRKGIMGKSIGIIIKDLDYPFYLTIASGAREYANGKGYTVIISSSEDNHESEKKLSYLFSTNNIDGMIIAPALEETTEIEHLFKLKMFNYPFVLLEDIKGIQANTVAIDNVNGVKQAVKYLIKNGHTKIVYFTGLPQSSQFQERIEGFRHAFSESTLVFNNEMIVPIGSHYDESFSNTIKYFKNKKKKKYPSAIVCFNDNQALAVIDALKEMKIKVPDDISIIGNDDVYYAKKYPLPLTTIRTPLNEMGMKAAEILIRNIESPKILPNERVIFETEFIIRESTKSLSLVYSTNRGRG